MSTRWTRCFALDLLDDRYPALHGLRVLAILTVVQLHVTMMFMGRREHIELDAGFADASLSVFYGMDLFFVLSGFLIGSILLRSAEDGKPRVFRFYLRRIFRTFPAYYVVLTVLALALPLSVVQRANLPWEYAYLTNFRPVELTNLVMSWGWSLAIEEQFYLVVPVLLFALRALRSDRARVVLLVALWLVALVARLVVYLDHDGPWDDHTLYGKIYFATLTRFDTLIAGVLLAVVHARWGGALTEWLRDPFRRAWIAVGSLVPLWLLVQPSIVGEENLPLLHVFAWGTLTSIMYVAWLVLLLHTDGVVKEWLSRPVFRALATLGYGVYLVHIPLGQRVVVPLARRIVDGGVPGLVVWPASVAALVLASLAVAYVLHVVVEKPFLRLRDRVAA